MTRTSRDSETEHRIKRLGNDVSRSVLAFQRRMTELL